MTTRSSSSKFVLLAALLSLGTWAFAANSNADQQLLNNAGQVVQTMSSSNQIPSSVVNQAKCVAVVPSLTKGGFIVGAEHGNGVVTCRTDNGWSAPAFISISGGSLGLQAGGMQEDIVLLMNQQGQQDVMNGNFSLSANAVAAGPTGANAGASASTWSAPILSYKRSKNGAFAGASIQGSNISIDHSVMHKVYGQNKSASQILNGSVRPPSQAQTFLNNVQNLK
jgi:lipid-binding SYLF domain-containing protein